MVWGFSNKKLISVEDYSMIFKIHGKRRYSAKKTKESCCYHSKSCTQVVSTACFFEILGSHYGIQCCWRKVLAIREIRRLKQEANTVTTDPIQDLRANLLEEGGNDTVQPCDTNQARSDSDFGVKVSTVQLYAIEHNFKSNR